RTRNLARTISGFRVRSFHSRPGMTVLSTSSPRRRETVCPRHRPGVAEARVAGAVDQFARAQRRIELGECLHLGGGGSLREMDRAELLRVFEPGGGEEFGQRVQGGVMIIIDPL